MRLSEARHRKKASSAQEDKFAYVMREGYAGRLHSGSKSGPIVTNPAQMKAIAASQSGMARRRK